MRETPLESPSREDGHADNAVLRKVDRHLLPILCWLAIVTSLNATNIGNAAIEGMAQDLHMRKKDYNIAVFVFYIPCILLGVPANIIMLATRPRIFLCSSMFLSGTITVIEGITDSYAGLVVCRVLLGVCETCFWAGSIYLIASYYPGNALHSRMSPFIACRLISSAFGSLLGYAFGHMDGIAGYSAWRWIFIIEGILASLSAAVAVSLVPGWPEHAKFLLPHEKDVVLRALERDHHTEQSTALHVSREVVRDPKVYFSALIHFCCAATGISSAVFLPTILLELGWMSLKAMYMVIPVYLVAAVVSLCNGLASDYVGRRYPFCIGPLLPVVAAFSILLAGEDVNVAAQYAACFLLTAGNFAGQSIAITWLSNNIISKKKRGIALGFVASLGNCGAVLGSHVYLKSEAPRFPTGYGVCLALSVLAVIAALVQFLYLISANRHRQMGSRHIAT